jgi:parallel beta-helix repeat protein
MKNFFTISFLFLFTFFSFNSFATTYYLSSSSGNDNNSGTDPSSPWRSINKLNSFYNLKPGDNVLFKRGDTFYGSIKVNNSGSSGSPITYGAYGSGAKPVITGFTTITSWNNLGSNIWESSNAVSTLPYTNMVSVNGVNTAMGRYPNSTGPNTGYLSIASHSGSTSITADGGLGSNNWTGAGIVIRKERFCIEKGTISSQSGNTLYYSDPNTFSVRDHFGFFIQNDPKTLDVNGEWYYNPSTKKLRIYSSSTPNNVQIASVENLVIFNDQQGYITFDNIDFKGSNSDALYCVSYGSNLTVQNCDISLTGFSGIWCGMPNSIIQNNNISYTNYLGIVSTQYNATIQYNNIKNIDMFEGMDQNLSSGGAISTTGANTVVQYNTVNTVGYSGIKFGGLNTKIQHNFINSFCNIKEDGGGIDMSARDRAKGSVIDANIVLNGIGAGQGTSQPTNLDFGGIFIDAYGTGITITNNTVANVATSGIKLHGTNNIIVKNNTCYNNGGSSWAKGGLQMLSSSLYPIQNITLQGNIFFARTTQQVSLFAYPQSIVGFGTADYNYYAKPIDGSNEITVDGTQFNVAGWRIFSGQDANSKESPKSITDLNDLRFEYNATSSSKTISLDANYIDVKNNAYNGSVTLAPYTSVVLIKTGAKQVSSVADTIADTLLPAVDPSNTVNGIDYKYYEGSDFSMVPDFSKLTPVKTGTVTNYDLSAIPHRTEGYAVSFSGFIDVPADGQYTFYTSSDDGSLLYIDNQLVVNNDGLHSSQEKSGSVGLKAGKHAITVGFTQQTGDASLSVSYSGPGISKQVIPSTASYRVADGLLPAVNPSNIVNGIDYKYYEASDFSTVPDFSKLTPVKTGTVTHYDNIYVANRSEEFAINFSGYIDVPADGQYTFYTSSDDGSKLYIDNQLVVNNDGEHSLQERSGTIGLKAGKHAISVGYFQGKVIASLSVSYSGPGISKQAIPSTVCYRISTVNSQRKYTVSTGIESVSDSIKPAMALDGSNLTSLKVGITAYPNPFTNSINVTITGEPGTYNLLLVDALGRTLWVKKGTKGDGTYQQIINTSSIQKGIYFLRVIQNNKSSVIKLEK